MKSQPHWIPRPLAWCTHICLAPASLHGASIYLAPASLHGASICMAPSSLQGALITGACSLCKTPSGLHGHPRGYPNSTRRPLFYAARAPAHQRGAPASPCARRRLHPTHGGSPCASSTRRTTNSRAWRSERNAAFDPGSLIRATDSYPKTDEALSASRSAKHGRRRAPRVALGLTKDQDTHTDSALPAFRSTTRKHRLLLPTVAQSASFISERSLSNDTTDYDETPENGHPGRSESPLQRTARSDP